MKFDFVIGNPPYQDDNAKNIRKNPVYDKFMDEAFKVSDCVELITPARFLFNAGQTSKAWNKKMLQDEHFKVMCYESNASTIFPNTDIKGGVAITIKNQSKKYGKIEIYTEKQQLNSILHNIIPFCDINITSICFGAVPYKYTNDFKIDFPKCVYLAGNSFDLRTNALSKLNNIIFFKDKNELTDSIGIVGLLNKQRTTMYVEKKYISYPSNFNKYKLLVSKANGSGKFGECLSQMIIAPPHIGHTQSFISIGSFNTKIEAENLEKYIKTKIVRCLLSVLRTTHDTTPYKWKYVPIQDFTNKSDIDWSLSISGIDKQLYKKYGFTAKEIDFIESNVKEMK